MRIIDTMVYLTDNGAALCGAHLGSSARATGRDISGQEIVPVTPDVLAEAKEMGWTIKCECCGRMASAWTVRKVDPRDFGKTGAARWITIDPNGAACDSFPTKKAAMDAIASMVSA